MTGFSGALFDTPLPGIGRPFTKQQGDQALKYVDLLLKWQKTHRLIGSVNPAWIVENVFLHSLCFLEGLPRPVRNVVDVGSGAGLPGIPIAIARPDLSVTLIEAKQRRVSFLSTVVRELGLDSVRVVGERVEHLGAGYTGRFDAAVMRCTGGPPTILAETFRILRSGGVLVMSSHSSFPVDEGAEAIIVRTRSGSARTFQRVTKP